MSMLQLIDWGMPRGPVYLWTLPMFHANGWCFAWAVTAAGGTHVCLRKVNAAGIFRAIREYGVDHFCAAPIVLAALADAPASERSPLPRVVRVRTAGSPPPATVLKSVSELGFEVEHVYGITESSGTPVSCFIQADWHASTNEEQARLKARQGQRAAGLEAMQVANPATLEPVPADGKSEGEILLRGNVMMKGYLKTRKRPETPSRAAGSTPEILPWCTRTDTFRSRIDPKTSSFRVAKIFHRSRSRMYCTNTQQYSSRR
jgi:fatty-acyl-CoA synthase